MKSGEEILAEIEATLDQLIQNASALNEVSGDSELQKKQDRLLDHLLHMDRLLDDETKRHQLQTMPDLYRALEQKVRKFSTLNVNLLKERWVKKARVHRNQRTANS